MRICSAVWPHSGLQNFFVPLCTILYQGRNLPGMGVPLLDTPETSIVLYLRQQTPYFEVIGNIEWTILERACYNGVRVWNGLVYTCGTLEHVLFRKGVDQHMASIENDQRKAEIAAYSASDTITTYTKSNRLVNAKGRASAHLLQLTAIGISRVKQNSRGELVSSISGQELRKIFNNNNGSFYEQVRKIIKPEDRSNRPSILDWRVYIENEDESKITGINVVSRASFDGGELTIVWSPDLKDDIYHLKSNYTVLSLSGVVSLSSPYAIKLYEMLTSELNLQKYRLKKQGKTANVYTKQMSLDELRVFLGTSANHLVKGEKDLYLEWKEFRRKVLEKAIAEINDSSQIPFSVSFDTVKGAGGRVKDIVFMISYKPTAAAPYAEEPDVSAVEASRQDITAILYGMGENYTVRDAKGVYAAFGGDMGRITRALKSIEGRTDISNAAGYLISIAQAESRKASTSTRQKTPGKGRAKSKNEFNNFEQNSYDMKALEERLLNT